MLLSSKFIAMAAAAVQTAFGLDIVITDQDAMILYHSDNALVRTRCQKVSKYLSDIQNYDGEREGCVMPVASGGKTQGYIYSAETGRQADLESVRLFMELVNDYDAALSRISGRMYADSNLAAKLLNENLEAFGDEMEIFAARCGYKISHPMAVIVVSIEHKYNHWMNADLGYELAADEVKVLIVENLRRHMYFYKQDIFAFMHDNCFAVIKAFDETDDLHSLYLVLDKLQEAVREEFSKYNIFDFYIAAGEIVKSYRHAGISYRQAREKIDKAYKLNLPHKIVKSEDVLMHLLEDQIPEDLVATGILPGVAALGGESPEAVRGLLECFDHYADNGQNTATTAKSLFLHRNTVKKRLLKLKELTKFDPFGDYYNITMLKMVGIHYRKNEKR